MYRYSSLRIIPHLGGHSFPSKTLPNDSKRNQCKNHYRHHFLNLYHTHNPDMYQKRNCIHHLRFLQVPNPHRMD